MPGTNFPTSADDSTSLPDPTVSSYTNNPSHFGLHANENAAIKAIEAKIGIGASTPPGGGYIFTSSSSGVSSWQAAPAAGVWGLITGTLSSQTDLQTALNTKVQVAGDISGTITAPIVATSNGVAIVTTTGAQTLTNKILTAATATADPVANLGVATKQYVDALGSTSLVRNETPGGLVNSSNTAYTTSSTFATGSLKVYLNGQRLAPGSGIDYVEVTQGFTMQYAPATGDVLLVDYETTNTTRFVQGTNSYIVQETPTGLVNSSNTLYTTSQVKYVANTLEVYINGLLQSKTTDYTETSPGSGTFTMVVAPTTSDDLRVAYQFATGASGNADTVDGIHASATATANTLLPLDSNSVLQAAAAFLSVRRSDAGVNSTVNNAKIQFGWGYAQGTGTTFANATITYPTAFTTSPMVLVSSAGYKDTSAPTTITDTTGIWEVLTPGTNAAGTTTCSVRLGAGGNTIASTRWVLFTWIAIGV